MKDTYGTINKIDEQSKKLEIRTDDKGAEVTLPLAFTERAWEWYTSHKSDFPVKQVVLFTAARGELFKMKPAQQMPTPAQKSNETIVNEKLKQAGCVPNPENKDYSERQYLSKEEVRNPGFEVKTIGTYDPKGVTVKIRTTCPTPTQYENIAIEVEGPDAETCRRALIDSYSVLGNAHPATKDFIAAHIKRVLLKGE